MSDLEIFKKAFHENVHTAEEYMKELNIDFHINSFPAPFTISYCIKQFEETHFTLEVNPFYITIVAHILIHRGNHSELAHLKEMANRTNFFSLGTIVWTMPPNANGGVVFSAKICIDFAVLDIDRFTQGIQLALQAKRSFLKECERPISDLTEPENIGVN